MSGYLYCDCCETRIEEGSDFQEVQLARMGFPSGRKIHICGKCEKTKHKDLKLTIKRERDKLSRFLAVQAAQQGKPGGVVSATGGIPPFPGPGPQRGKPS